MFLRSGCQASDVHHLLCVSSCQVGLVIDDVVAPLHFQSPVVGSLQGGSKALIFPLLPFGFDLRIPIWAAVHFMESGEMNANR